MSTRRRRHERQPLTRKQREARIADLREQCQPLSNERARLEAINEREDAAPWVGKCFKYWNRDSHGKKGWWLYFRVLRHSHANSFVVLQCQSQGGGWHIVTTRDHVYLLPDPKARGYVEISRAAFDRAWRTHVARIGSLNR